MSRSFAQQIVGLFGQPVAENPTQAMVEAAFRAAGLDWRYLTLEVAPEALADAVRGARAMGFRGFHCTIPHKVAVVEHLDEIAASARLIGAVNTVVAREGALVGENTDGKGLLRALASRMDVDGAHAVLFGAGGAARAIAVELALAGAARITVVNRTEERGRALVEATPTESELVVWTGDFALPSDATLVVNATSIGLHPDTSRVPVDTTTFRSAMLAADVIPNPPRTRFLGEAEAAGCETLDGLEMLVEQGALSVELWTGVEPDRAVMRAALADAFAA